MDAGRRVPACADAAPDNGPLTDAELATALAGASHAWDRSQEADGLVIIGGSQGADTFVLVAFRRVEQRILFHDINAGGGF